MQYTPAALNFAGKYWSHWLSKNDGNKEPCQILKFGDRDSCSLILGHIDAGINIYIWVS